MAITQECCEHIEQVLEQHPTKLQRYSHLPPIMKTIKIRWTRHARHCLRSRDKLIRDVLLWTPSYVQAKAGRPARTYMQQICAGMGCSPEDLLKAMHDREVWHDMMIEWLSSVWIFWLVWFYSISTFVGYLTPNPFLCK